MAEKEKAISEMELQPDEARRVRIALVKYVEKVLANELPVDPSVFGSAMHSLDRMMDRSTKM